LYFGGIPSFGEIPPGCFDLLFLPIAYCQSNYWQQELNYTIDVSLNDKEHTLDGLERIEYINNSPDTLRFIWFHVWPNAYKNDKTAFTDQDSRTAARNSSSPIKSRKVISPS